MHVQVRRTVTGPLRRYSHQSAAKDVQNPGPISQIEGEISKNKSVRRSVLRSLRWAAAGHTHIYTQTGISRLPALGRQCLHAEAPIVIAHQHSLLFASPSLKAAYLSKHVSAGALKRWHELVLEGSSEAVLQGLSQGLLQLTA